LIQKGKTVNVHVYGKIRNENPHLRGVKHTTRVVSAEELAKLTADANVYVEGGYLETMQPFPGVADTSVQEQFRKDCPQAVLSGRMWWIPLEPGDHVIAPAVDGGYVLCTAVK
jgi:hypothetical protein